MLAPKRVLHRKVQRGSMKGHAKGNTKLYFGEYGLRAEEAHWITNRQIEAARVAITGSPSSRTSPSPRSRQRPAWVPVRATPRSGWPS